MTIPQNPASMLLIDVPVMKPQRQDSTGGATGQSRVVVDSGDDLDEVQVGPYTQDKVTELKQHVIEVISISSFLFLLLKI